MYMYSTYQKKFTFHAGIKRNSLCEERGIECETTRDRALQSCVIA